MEMPGDQMGGSMSAGVGISGDQHTQQQIPQQPPPPPPQQQQHQPQQQNHADTFQPLADPMAAHQAAVGGPGVMTEDMMNQGSVGGMMGAAGVMSGGLMGGGASGVMGGGGGGYQQPGIQAAAVPQRPAKKVPDWLIQTLKEKEALAEKQKKKEGMSLSTDVTSSSSGGAGNISGYNLVHSPSPSPPGSPSDGGERGKMRRAKPSWHEADDSDDPEDEVSPTKESRERRAANGTGADAGRNGAKPAGILKSGRSKAGTRRPVEEDDGDEDDDSSGEAAVAPKMDDDTRAAFDREIRRLLTQVLKEGTANISREVAMSAVEEARHATVAAAASARLKQLSQSHPVRVRSKKEKREQKKAMGALIGGYGSDSAASASDSEGDESPTEDAAPQVSAPATTVSGEENTAGRGPLAAESKRVPDPSAEASGAITTSNVEASSSTPAARKIPVKIGGKWPLPAWADLPHEKPLPDGIAVVVETIGPDLEVMKMQELAFTTTVMGRFEEQCGFIVEDGSASRFHAAIL